jgi:nickel-dependent lactate racemase
MPLRAQEKQLLEQDPRIEKLDELWPNPVDCIPADRLAEELDRALDHPLGALRLEEAVRGKQKIVFCVSDRTRIFPKNEMIRAVLERISPHVEKKNLTFIVAGGNHKPQTPAEAGIDADLAAGYRWVSHRSRDRANVYVGKTSRRLGGFLGRYVLAEAGRAVRDLPADLFKLFWYPLSGQPSRLRFHLGLHFGGRIGLVARSSAPTKVYLNPAVAEADLVVTIGQVKPHYFAGYSGGAKSILPAVTSLSTITSNHFMRSHPAATLGVVRDNPIRLDMEAAALLAGEVFVFNCVLDGRGRPYGFFAGDLVQSHRKASRAALEVGGVKAEPSDVVVVSAGPPVDLSLYQFTKAVAPAIRVVKPQGVIVAIGDCPEGIGNRFIVNEIIYKLGFKHRIPRGVDLFLISKMPDKVVNTTFCRPMHSLEQGLEYAAKKFGRDFSVNLMPQAGPMMPYLEGENPLEWI